MGRGREEKGEGWVYHVSLQNLLKIRSVRRKILFPHPFIEFAAVFICPAYQDASEGESRDTIKELKREKAMDRKTGAGAWIGK